MAMLPLIQSLQREAEVEQIWFADDSAAGGNVNDLQSWWNRIVKKSPAFGYYVNSKKTWLVGKEDQYENAVKCFEDTDVQSPQVAKDT